jgi:C4-type Zn-finger protein
MKCPKCGSEMQEEGEFVSDEDEDVGGSWEGNGIWGCPKCGSEMISTFPEAYIPYKGWVEVEIIVCRNCGHEEKVKP